LKIFKNNELSEKILYSEFNYSWFKTYKISKKLYGLFIWFFPDVDNTYNIWFLIGKNIIIIHFWLYQEKYSRCEL
jgi:hypothetical protein